MTRCELIRVKITRDFAKVAYRVGIAGGVYAASFCNPSVNPHVSFIELDMVLAQQLRDPNAAERPSRFYRIVQP